MPNLKEDIQPLWIGKQKYNKDFPIYKFVVEKSIYTINEEKLAKREEWQRFKFNNSNEHETISKSSLLQFAEKLLSGKNNKREWLFEYATLWETKKEQKSFQSLTNHRNLVQVYEQFNWLVWAVGYFYFQNDIKNDKFGLPPQDNDAWVEGFTWKGVYFRLLPLEQSYLLKREIEAIKHITLEIDEWYSLEEKYSERFNIETEESYHRKIIPPLLSVTECGSYAIYGCPVIPIQKSGKSSPSISIKNLQKSQEIDLSDSMLQLMPYLSKLTPENLVPIYIDGIEDKYIIVNCHQVLTPYCPDLYSKCIIRIPEEINEEISIYQYPRNGTVSLDDLISLFIDGRIEDNQETPRSTNQAKVAKEREFIRECDFTAQGWKMKILLYDRDHDDGQTLGENERAKAVFMSRDDRVFRMASIKNKPNMIKFITNDIFGNSIVGESEIINGDVLLVVEQWVEDFILPYSLSYNKPVRKPEIYVERSIDRAKEILEANNDICSDIALKEFMSRKGIHESAVWVFAVQVRSKLIQQISKWIILANTVKRIIDKEIFVTSSMEGDQKIPKGIYRDGDVVAPLFVESITYVLESLMTKKLRTEPKLTKNLLMTLFFYRLESLQFHNSLQFEVGTKDYLQGKAILNDIIQVANENPLLFLKTCQNIWNVNFSIELLRKWGVDRYEIINSEHPFQIETDENETNISARLHNYAPVSVRERMYFIMASFISQKEYAELNEEESYSRQTGNSSSVKNSYLEEESESEKDQENSSSQESEEEDDASNESYDSVESLKKENSPPFKQAKFDKTDTKKLLNSVYSSRLSMISSNDNVLRASHPLMNLNKNFIESDNNYKKCQYLSKKVFLHLPSSLYRLKLHTIELDSFEASKFSVMSHQVKNADFLQEFSILRQNYVLQSIDEINKWVMFIESAFKDVFSIEGDESAFLEIILINNFILFICDKFEDIIKNMEKTREILFNLSKCPLEIISMMQTFAGLLFEKENIVESEKEYLMALIHYFVVLSDPRGRGWYSSNYLLSLTWKASMIAHYYKKQIDAELWEELLDATIYNLAQSRSLDKAHLGVTTNEGPARKWSKLGQPQTKNKFAKTSRTSPHKPIKRDSNTKINIDDIDIELLSTFKNETGDPFDDLKYTLSDNRFLFYHWDLYKQKVEDVEDYMKYGAGNQLDFFIYLLRCNPCMFMSGIKFSNAQIREFTFSDGVNNMLNLKSTSSIVSGKHNLSSSMSNASYSSDISSVSTKEKRQRSLHHGAYQHILNKDHYGFSRSESNGVAYVWGTDNQGQLGWSNIANLKFDEMDDDFKRFYPRILIGLKDFIIKDVWCGNEHSLAITIEGNVFAWGNNKNKQLGIGYNTPSFVNQPTRVYNIKNVASISCGYEHSIALTTEGDVYSWGHGEGGLLGHGELDDQAVPKLIEEFKKKKMKMTKVAWGGLHTLAISDDGELFTWGRGEGGQLGLSRKALESLERLDWGISVPICIIKDKTMTDIAAGVAHSIALCEDGRVYGWGNSNYGQLGLGFSGESFEPGTGNAESSVFEPTLIKSLSKVEISKIYAGSTFSMFLSSDEELYACGINDLGQCGIDTAHEELRMFEQIKDKTTQKMETTLDINIPRKLEWFYGMEVKGVACGEDHAFAVINSGEKNKKMIWGWGMYKAGQLGLGNIKKRTNPRLLQTLYNSNILPDKISWGSSNTLCIIGDPYIYEKENSDSDSDNENLNKSIFKGFEQECWNIVEYQEEENFQLKMAEYN